MATYVVGDIQGCCEPLSRLLDTVRFAQGTDMLWCVGDLVNRGPASLQAVRLVRSLGSSFEMVLGNHDLHLLAVAHGVRQQSKKDTLSSLLEAPDSAELIEWFSQRPIAAMAGDALLVHAGVDPRWTLSETLQHAQELERLLRGPNLRDVLRQLFGNTPARFSTTLNHVDRARCITNIFTRLRFCSSDGFMDFDSKGRIDSPPAGSRAWFQHPGRALRDQRILFGHWAALNGQTDTPNVEALDTGCAWGKTLTALRLEDNQRFSVPAHKS